MGSVEELQGCNITSCIPIVKCVPPDDDIDNGEYRLPVFPDEYVAAVPDPEYDNITWTLPTGASDLRLSLPADIDDFLFDAIEGITENVSIILFNWSSILFFIFSKMFFFNIFWI